MFSRIVVFALFILCGSATARADWVSAGLADQRVRAVLQTPAGNRFAATTGGLFRSRDGGSTWGSIEPTLFADAFGAIAGRDSNHIFIAVEAGVYRSSDDGESWILLPQDITGTYSLAAAPNGDLYASGSSGTWRSTDRGLSWMQVEVSPGNFTDGLAIDTDGRVYLESIVADLFRSEDNGASWDVLNPTAEFKSALAVSPRTGTVLVGTQTFDTPSLLSIYRSTDHGTTWQRVVHRAGAIDAVHFLGNGHALAGADIVLYSTDDGLTWLPRNAGMPVDAQVDCFGDLQGEVFAGLRNAGLWRETSLLVSAPLPTPGGDRGVQLRATPSPFTNRSTLTFTLPQAARVSLELFGLQGQRIAHLADGEFPAGSHLVPLDARGSPAGLYFARLTTAAACKTLPLVLLK